jgi:hypothetical protein
LAGAGWECAARDSAQQLIMCPGRQQARPQGETAGGPQGDAGKAMSTGAARSTRLHKMAMTDFIAQL